MPRVDSNLALSVASAACGIGGAVLVWEALTKKANTGDEIVFGAFGIAALIAAFLIWWSDVGKSS